MKDFMLSEYLLSDWGEDKGSGNGSGGSGGGGGDEGCGIIALVFFACLLLSAQCNNSRVNENYMNPSNSQTEIVERD